MSKKIVALLVAVGFILTITHFAVAATTTKIMVQHPWVGPDAEAFAQMISIYEKNNPHVKFENVYVPRAQYVERVLMQTMTKSGADLTYVDSPDLAHLTEAGSLLDLTSLVEKWGQWEDYIRGARAATKVEGKIYALQVASGNLGIFYNVDLLSEAGLPGPPETWDELLLYAEKLTKGHTYAIAFTAFDNEGGTWQFLPFLWSNEGDLLDLYQPEAIEALELWTTLVRKGYASRDVVNWEQDSDVPVQFLTAKAAMMENGPWQIVRMREESINFGITRIPTPKRGMLPVVPMGGDSLAITGFTTPEKRKEAWNVLSWLVEFQQMLDWNMARLTLPPRTSVAAEAAKREPLLKPFIDSNEVALVRQLVGGGKKYPQVSAITRTAIQEALVGKATPTDALKKAAMKIKELMAE